MMDNIKRNTASISAVEAAPISSAPKPDNLNDAIYEMYDTIQHANSLLSRITCPEDDIVGPPDHCQRALSDILTNGPEDIRDINRNLHDILGKIENNLF